MFLRVFLFVWAFFLWFPELVIAGVPIEISPSDYEKFLSDVDVATKTLPSEWESYQIQKNELKLPSGVALPVSEIKKLAKLSPNELLNFFESKGIHVRVLCSSRENYLKTVFEKK